VINCRCVGDIRVVKIAELYLIGCTVCDEIKKMATLASCNIEPIIIEVGLQYESEEERTHVTRISTVNMI